METVKHVHKRHGSIKNSGEEAMYDRDEVQGPLRGSTTGTVDELDVKEKLRENKTNMTTSERDVSHKSGFHLLLIS
jgi:hypothetical protein